MHSWNAFSKKLILIAMTGALAGCGEPRAVLLPLQYPDGTAVRTVKGDPVMAGYQTYGSAMHANATALYAQAAPASCVTCAQVGAVVSEPSVLRQATGVLGVSTVGAGAVMGGLGMMNYGNAAVEGKLGTNVVTQDNVSAPRDNRSYDNHAYDNRGYYADNRRDYGTQDAGHGY